MRSEPLAEEFRKLWDSEDCPDLASFLRGCDDVNPRDLLDVLLVDQYRCWQSGSPKPIDEYLALLLPIDADQELVIELLDEEIGYQEDHAGGVDLPAFLEQFPQISDLAKQKIADLAIAGDSTSMVAPSLVRPRPIGPEHVPKRLGRFDIVRQLGRGTFGVVYLARDTELKREVAIKVPSQQQLELAGGADSFLREARVVAGLDHAGIVPVYDVGRLDTGECYVVSKYVPGGDLNRLVQRERLTPREAAKLISQIARALHQAHRKGLVHRDIKPGNILIDEAGKPHIIDFGLALKDKEAGRDIGACRYARLHEPRAGSRRGAIGLILAATSTAWGSCFTNCLPANGPIGLIPQRSFWSS